jgi:chromosome segregation ATPase
MGEEELGSPGIAKSVRSLVEALATLEREAEMIFDRASATSATAMAGYVGKVAAEAGRRAAASLDLAALLKRASEIDFAPLLSAMTGALGLADEASLEAVRADMREVIEQVGRLRERELALAGGVSQLRAKTARFEEALAGVARVQGKCVARLDGQVDSARKLEHLAGRRDDHITRLIRDTAGQRAELERLARELDAVKRAEQETKPAAETMREVSDVRAKLGQLETQYADLKKLQAGSTQRIIETLESMRDRVGKLEMRAAEMSREARAKAGRLDALARHVATVEGRLTTAIGNPGEAIVAVPQDVDRALAATG